MRATSMMMDSPDTEGMEMMGGMGVMMLIGLLVLAILIGVAVYLAVRAAQAGGSREATARETLQQRLASGEITPDEYYERESALREADGGRTRRFGRG